MNRQVVWLRKRFDPGNAGRIIQPADLPLICSEGELDVFKPNGDPLVFVRRAVFSREDSDPALEDLRAVAEKGSTNRGVAAGKLSLRTKKTGEIARTTIAPHVPSAVVGFFDRSSRFPFCRQTVVTAEHAALLPALVPVMSKITTAFRASVPGRFRIQSDRAAQVNPAFVIPGTPWTTITVNRNWQTRLHTDKGDLPEGFSTLAVLRRGTYRGGVLGFPAYGIGVDLRHGDVVFMDAHEGHANTPFTETEEGWERISLVLYFRTKMTECLSPEEELSRAKKLRGPLDVGTPEEPA